MSDIKFIPMKSVFSGRCGPAGIGTDFVKVLPKRLTLDPTYVGGRWLNDRCTLFKDVKMQRFAFAMPSYVYALFDLKVGSVERTQEEMLDRLVGHLQDAIHKTWQPGVVHVMMHSSGLDSRVVSFLIKHLHKQLGDEWLGQVLFLCSKWEGESFKRIMEYEGWEPHQYAVPYEDLKKPVYYSTSLADFENAWRWNNGASAIPVNLFWWPVQWAIDTGRIDKVPDQMYTGQWGNTVLDRNVTGQACIDNLKDNLVMFYYSILCSRPMHAKQVINPYTYIPIAEEVITSSVRLGVGLRPALVRHLDPGLAEFTNMMADGDRHNRIAPGLVGKMIEDYDKSWYGSRVHIGARPKWKTTEFQPFWYHWSAASLCEHLRKNGYDIRVAS